MATLKTDYQNKKKRLQLQIEKPSRATPVKDRVPEGYIPAKEAEKAFALMLNERIGTKLPV